MNCEMTAIAKVDGERRGDDCNQERNGRQYGERSQTNNKYLSNDPHQRSEGQQPHNNQSQVDRSLPNEYPSQLSHSYNRNENQNRYTGENKTVYPLRPNHSHYNEHQDRPWVLRNYSNGRSPPSYNSEKSETAIDPSKGLSRNKPGLINHGQMSGSTQDLIRPQCSSDRNELPYNLKRPLTANDPSDAILKKGSDLRSKNSLSGGPQQQQSIRHEPPSYESESPQIAIDSTDDFVQRNPNLEVQSALTQSSQGLSRPRIQQSYGDQQFLFDPEVPRITINPADAFLRDDSNRRGPFPWTSGSQDATKPWKPHLGTLANGQSLSDSKRLRISSASVDPYLRRNSQNEGQTRPSGGTQDSTRSWISQQSSYRSGRYPNNPERLRIAMRPSDAFIKPGDSRDLSSSPGRVQSVTRPWIPQETSNIHGQLPYYSERPQFEIDPADAFTGRNSYSVNQSPSSLSPQKLTKPSIPHQPSYREGQSSYESEEPEIISYPADFFLRNDSQRGFSRSSEAPLYRFPSNNQFSSSNFQRATAFSGPHQLPAGSGIQPRYEGEGFYDYQGSPETSLSLSSFYRGIAIPQGQEQPHGRLDVGPRIANTRSHESALNYQESSEPWPYGSPEGASPYGRITAPSAQGQLASGPGIELTMENSMTHEYPTNYQRRPVLLSATHPGVDPRLSFHAGGMGAEIDPTKLFRGRTGGGVDLRRDGLSVDPKRSLIAPLQPSADPRIADVQSPNAVVDIHEGGRKIESDFPYQKPLEGYPRRDGYQVDFPSPRVQFNTLDVAPTATLEARPLEASMNLPRTTILAGQERTAELPYVHGGKNYEFDPSKFFRSGIGNQAGFKLPVQGAAEESITPNKYQVDLSSPPLEVPSATTLEAKRIETSMNSPRIALTPGNELVKPEGDPQSSNAIFDVHQGDIVIDPSKMFKKVPIDSSRSVETPDHEQTSEYPGVGPGSSDSKSPNSAINIHAFGKDIEIDPTELFKTRTGGGVKLSREGMKIESDSKGASIVQEFNSSNLNFTESGQAEGRRFENDPSKLAKARIDGGVDLSRDGIKFESHSEGPSGIEYHPSSELEIENTGSKSGDVRTDGKMTEIDPSKLFKLHTGGKTESAGDKTAMLAEGKPIKEPMSRDSYQVELSAPKLQIDAPEISSNVTLETKPLGGSIDPSRSVETPDHEQTSEYPGVGPGSSDSKSPNSAINIHAFGKDIEIDPTELFKTRTGGGVKLSREGMKIESDSKGASIVQEFNSSNLNFTESGQAEGRRFENDPSIQARTGGDAETGENLRVQFIDKGVQYNSTDLNESSRS